MSVLNQVILGVLLMVTLIVIALMVRVYSRKKGANGTLEVKESAQSEANDAEDEI
jgi:hypothetical protein